MQTARKRNTSKEKNSHTVEEKYVAKLYYHDHLEQQFSGAQLNRLLAKLHLKVQSMRTGTAGYIWDATQNKVIHSCTYQAAD